jgi:anaerobic magnesium-protoporphyrin IX monomethyl ester cyclase
MKVKTLLLSLPQSPTNQSYSSLPSLTGFLRMHNCQVEQRDINIEAYDSLLTPQKLSHALVIVEKRLRELEQIDSTDENVHIETKALLQAQLSASYAIEHIEEAKRVKQDPSQFYDLKRCSWAHNILLRALELHSAAHYPSRWTLDDLVMGSDVRNNLPTLASLLKVARNDKENIFLEFLRDEILSSIIKAPPQLIGMSLTYATQVIPTLALADLIKAADPTIHICIGGAWVKKDRMWSLLDLYSIIDSVVIGEGEHALLTLIQKLECQDNDWSDVPHLLYLRDSKVLQSKVTYLEDVNMLPTPDWSGLPLELYLSPEFVPLLPTARGCYWGRCAFCTFSSTTERKYRPRHIDLILKDMQEIHAKFGATHFSLSSDAESPRQMKTLAAVIIKNNFPFVWECETRFSPLLTPETCQILFEGGCRYLSFGMESACQRVLDWMDKGTQVADFGRVIQNCTKAGIGVNLMAFIGFPTESEEEACMTTDFMLTYRDYIDSVALGQFVLQPGSKVDLDPGRYGVTVIKREDHALADTVLGYTYQTNRGMTQSRVTKMLQHQFYKLGQIFSKPPAVVLLVDTFLYLAYYGVPSLREQKKSYRFKLENLMETKPKVSEQLEYVQLSSKREDNSCSLLFSPDSGELLTISAQETQLLVMCDGIRSVDQIAMQYASMGEVPEAFVIIYSQILRRLKRLCENGALVTVS